MSFDGVEFLWMNGRIRPWAEGTLHVASHALHYGSGVFEGIRCYETDNDGPAIFRLGPHLTRLYASADFYQMRLPYSPEELTQAMVELVSRNGFSDCYLRPIAFYGFGTLGVHPRQNPIEMAILAWKWGAYLGEEGLKSGVRVKFVYGRSFIRRWFRPWQRDAATISIRFLPYGRRSRTDMTRGFSSTAMGTSLKAQERICLSSGMACSGRMTRARRSCSVLHATR